MSIKPIDRRQHILKIAWELLHHVNECYYSEQSNRWDWHKYSVPTFPFTSDCSGTVTAINYWGDGNDPNGTEFEYGNTETILHHATTHRLIIAKDQLLHGDLVLFGPGPTPVHVVMSMQNTLLHKNPLCFSMGKPGDPHLVPLSVLQGLGKPTFVRNVTRR